MTLHRQRKGNIVAAGATKIYCYRAYRNYVNIIIKAKALSLQQLEPVGIRYT